MRAEPVEQRRSAVNLLERIIGNLQGIIRNELRLLNNSIKHEEKVSAELA